MSSAAKLRKYGRGTATVAAAALVMTSFGPAAFAQWDDAPQTSSVEAAQESGTIGIVDSDDPVGQVHAGHPAHDAGPEGNPPSDPVAENTSNHGATLVQAGQANQSIADVVFVLPNRFQSGDIIDLRLLDRSANEHQDGTSNRGPSTLVGFSADPSVSVGNASAADTRVFDNTEDASAANTESTLNNPWVAAPGATGAAAQTPGVKPTFTVSRSQSNGVQGYDNIRLRVNSDASTGDPNGRWVVRLSGLKVDLGSEVTPGELRVVPFASNKRVGGEQYFVSPWFQGNAKENAVTVDPAVTYDTGGVREIGTYTVPAYVSPVKVNAESASIVADGRPQTIGNITLTETKPYALGDGTYRLYINGADIANAGSTDITATMTGGDAGESVSGVSGVTATGDDYVEFTFNANEASSATPASITISGLLLTTSTPATIRYRFDGATLSDTWFALAGTSGPVAGTSILGSDAFVNGPLAQNAALDADVNVASTRLVSNPAPVSSSVSKSAAQIALPQGEYEVTADGSNFIVTGVAASGGAAGEVLGVTGNSITNGTAFVVDVGTNTTTDSSVVDGETYTFNNLTAGTTITVNAAGAIVSTSWTDPTTVDATGLAALPNGTYTVAANPSTTTTADFTITGPNGLVLGNSTTAGAVAPNIITDGTAYTTAAGNYTAGTSGIVDGQNFTFTNLAAGRSFTISGSNAYTLLEGVNQRDIVAPNDDLMQSGIAAAESARIGGNNRYETAGKVAEIWANGDKSVVNGKFRNAIIASGENFPDALSASYLSQRMGAPILLTMQGRLPADTIEALRDRQVEKVFIIGGSSAVSSDVEAQLRGLDTFQLAPSAAPAWNETLGQWEYPPNWTESLRSTGTKMQVQRLGGGTRYTTNQLVNMYAAAWGGEMTVGKTVYRFGEAGKYTAIFARGDNFPDALAAGVLTAGVKPATSSPDDDQALPLVLTQPDELSGSARDQIANLDLQHALIIGSENAISGGVKTSLEDLDLSTTRLGGPDRYFTAAAVDEFAMRNSVGSRTNEYPGLGFLSYSAGVPSPVNQKDSFLANGLKFPDALTAAPWIGRNGNALNLTMGVDDLSDGTKDFLTKRASDIRRAVALGLGNAVSTKVLNEANRLASAE